MSKTASFPHGNRIYPWDVWESGDEFTAKKGVHFRRMTVEQLQNTLHARASYMKRKVRTSVVSKTEVRFQFFDRDED
jgi:hypothetical protein